MPPPPLVAEPSGLPKHAVPRYRFRVPHFACAIARSARLLPAALAAGLILAATPARTETESATLACYPTGGGSLEICRSATEPEGVLHAAPPCRFAYGVQILRLKARSAPGPLQFVLHGEPRRETPRGRRDPSEPACEGDLRATDPMIGGSVRSGRAVEQLALTMPATEQRFWGAQAQGSEARASLREGRRGRRGRSRRARRAQPVQQAEQVPAAFAKEGSGGRDPMTVAGRDWAGDDYHYLFMIASEAVGENRRHALIQARTLDFETLDVRGRAGDADEVGWVPFGAQETQEAQTPRRGRRGRRGREPQPAPPALAPVLDETGRPITATCAAPGFDARGLVGSISVVDQVYHYFYTDVLPTDCNEPPAKRRMGLYLRTSRDLTAERPWSAAQTLVEGLPPDTLARVAKAKGLERWAVAYSCFRPANATGGPVADICLHYTDDLSPGAIKSIPFFTEPASAARSPAFLGLRSGGDGGGRYGRDGFFWMTDRYGNLDTPAIFPTKGGLLTWIDRLAPRSDASEGSSLYGRPVYWATWTLRPR